MKRILVPGLVLTLLAGGVRGDELPPLPAWSPSDFEKLRDGKIVSGEDFFGTQKNGSGESMVDLPEGALPEPPPEESELDASEISRVHLIRYFRKFPTDSQGEVSYLIDPQELLSQQEYRDRQRFLEYHASESSIDFFVYLFDGQQELPEDVTIQSVFADLFQNRALTAVVFYHLGMPERSQLVMSADIRGVVSEDEQNRALRAAVQEAFEKSDVANQLDNFLVELSIRLYWIEREMAGLTRTVSLKSGDAAAASGSRGGDSTRRLVYAAVLWTLCISVIGLLGWLMHYLVNRRIRYVFPEVESGPLLGAPHAAGVGAVVSFGSAQIPPSQQRDQVPDYLQRL